MSVLVIYADAADDSISSNSATYLTARSGGTLGTEGAGTNHLYVGQLTGYYLNEGFLSFDTSPLAGMTIDSAILAVTSRADNSTTDFTINCRLYDWGTSVTTADWIPGANLAALPLLCHYPTASGFTPGTTYYDFTDDAFAANLNLTGSTRVVLTSDRVEAATVPSGDEYVSVGSSSEAWMAARLTVTYQVASASGGDPLGMSGFFGQ